MVMLLSSRPEAMSDTLKKVTEANPDAISEGLMTIEIGKELIRRGKDPALSIFCMDALGVSPQDKVTAFLIAFNGAVQDEVNTRFRVPKTLEARSLTTDQFVDAAAGLCDPTLSPLERSRGVARLKRLMRAGQVH